jgi:hypothetical protein
VGIPCEWLDTSNPGSAVRRDTVILIDGYAGNPGNGFAQTKQRKAVALGTGHMSIDEHLLETP